MENVKDAVIAAKEKDFANFGDAVRKTIQQKLSNHPTIKDAEDDVEYFNRLKGILKSVGSRDSDENGEDD